MSLILLLIAFLLSVPRPLLHATLVFFPGRPAYGVAPGELLTAGPGRIVVSQRADGGIQLQVGEDVEEIAPTELGARLRLHLDARRDKAVYLDISPERDYGDAVELIDLVKGLGGRVVLGDVRQASVDGGWTP